MGKSKIITRMATERNGGLAFHYFSSVCASIVSNESVTHILQSAKEIFENNSLLTDLWPNKWSDQVTISYFLENYGCFQKR